MGCTDIFFNIFTEWSRLPSPMLVGLIQSVEDLNRTKNRVRENSFSLLDCLWAGTSTSSAFRAPEFIGAPRSPDCQMQILGLLRHHNPMSNPPPCINMCYICVCYIYVNYIYIYYIYTIRDIWVAEGRRGIWTTKSSFMSYGLASFWGIFFPIFRFQKVHCCLWWGDY